MLDPLGVYMSRQLVKGPVQEDITRVVASCNLGVTSSVVDEKRGWLFVGSDDTTASAWDLIPETVAEQERCVCTFEEHLVITKQNFSNFVLLQC